jgi:fructose-1,6-bisphosphatase I
MELEQTFMNFLLHHQERHNRTYHFLSSWTPSSARQTHRALLHHRGLEGNLGCTDRVNGQGEDVMQRDDIAHEIIIHYLKTTGRVIRAVSEESKDVIPLAEESGRYFIYFDPLDGSSNVVHGLPVGFLFGIAKRNLDGPEDFHLRAGKIT